MGHQRKGAKQNAFDPTENRGIGADPQGEAQDRQNGKGRIANQHPKTEAEVLEEILKHGVHLENMNRSTDRYITPIRPLVLPI